MFFFLTQHRRRRPKWRSLLDEAKQEELRDLIARLSGDIGMATIDIWRIVDFLTSAYLIARIVSTDTPWLNSRPARLVRTMGVFSLPVFAFSTLLSLFGKLVTESSGSSVMIDLFVTVTGIVLMAAFAELLVRYHGAIRPARLSTFRV